MFFFSIAVVGVLKGYDMLMNVVLDDSIEYIKSMLSVCFHSCKTMHISIIIFVADPSGGGASLTETRPLGLMITRGISIQVISPEENRVQIENPFQ